MTEKRACLRAHTERPVLLTLSDGSKVRATMNNISTGGIGILYSAPAEIGKKFTTLFQINMDNETYNIQAKAIARFCHIKGEYFYTGLEFEELGEQNTQLIHRFVEHRLSSVASQNGIAPTYRNRTYK